MARGGLLAALMLALAGGAAGCKRHEDTTHTHVTPGDDPLDSGARLVAGPAAADSAAYRPRPLPVENPFAGDVKAIQEGRRLYRWMNCIGCHAEGGGSIGPALWDDQWRYGGRGVDIAESILFGRPDGMPAFAGHLPQEEVWRIVAYVQSLEPRGGPYHAGVE